MPIRIDIQKIITWNTNYGKTKKLFNMTLIVSIQIV
jgi:hypothetical protein